MSMSNLAASIAQRVESEKTNAIISLRAVARQAQEAIDRIESEHLPDMMIGGGMLLAAKATDAERAVYTWQQLAMVLAGVERERERRMQPKVNDGRKNA